tara:strand:+ start:182 stop:493 length:312 start_codon:yes stop_codon:yes gene_type:complete
MTNSDYLIKATIKKISDKLNKTLFSKIDKAAAAAQEVPELLKKEIEILKYEILNEAKKMEEESENESNNKEQTSPEDLILIETSKKISSITQKLNELNNILEN